ncbi:MAG TPA: NCS2 family permease [Longimicrobiales bacterium]|nr:NCS2 family permease [Longimicrobiales bacterium]
MLERWFQLQANNTTVRVELQAGLATFLTMAYVVVVNPGILADAGVPFEGALFATCAAAALATLTIGLLANYPFALAPGMGLNAFFAYTVVGGMGVPWEVALGAVFLSGVIFIVLTVSRVRAMIVDAIPDTLKVATAAGIGLFIAFIGFRNAGFVVAHPATLVGLGDVASPAAGLAAAGLIVTAALMARGHTAAIIIGIALVSAVAMALGLEPLPAAAVAVPDPSSTFLALDIPGALGLGLLDIVFVFLFVDMFDTVGSFMGLARQAGYVTPDGRIPRMNRALLADSTGTVAGALLGTSTVTTYIESAAGIGAGGRTGLTAVVVALLFALAAFAAPLAAAIPAYATAPALIIVGALMIRAVRDVEWPDMTEAVPAFITMVGMPLTFSIANGLALGFIAYPGMKLLAGRGAEVRPLVWVLALLFVARFVYLG